jgi:hypothetical protein
VITRSNPDESETYTNSSGTLSRSGLLSSRRRKQSGLDPHASHTDAVELDYAMSGLHAKGVTAMSYPLDYEREIVAPRSVKVFCSFSASSLGKFSFSVCGTDSTNFLA